MPRRCRDRIVELLRYPENLVGGVMINDIFALTAGTSAADAKRIVQERMSEGHFTSVIFVADDDSRRLRGAVPLRDLLSAPDDRCIEEFMDPYVEPLDPFASASEAAYKIVSGQLAAMPVVNSEGRLIGAMTVEAAIALLVPANSGIQSLRVFS